MQVMVCPATLNDAESIVAVFLGCWRETYAGVLPDRLLDKMTDNHASALWTRVLGESAVGEVMVAKSVEVSVATILGVARIAMGTGGKGSVHSLYVSPQSQGEGVGARLLGAACDALAASGVRVARLWVFKDNAPSIAFYRHNRWLPDGHSRVQEEFGEPEIRLAKTLRPDTDSRSALNLSEVDVDRAQDLDAGLWLRSSPVTDGVRYLDDVVMSGQGPGLGITGIASGKHAK